MNQSRALQTFILLLSLNGAVAQAQTSAAPRTWFQLSETFATWKMQTRSDVSLFSSPAAAPIQVEDTLGAPRRSPITGLQFGRLIGERWRVEVEHTRSRRDGQATLAADLDVGGVTYLGGTTLRSDLGLTTLGVNGGAALLKNETNELGLLFGGFWLRTNLRTDGFSGTGAVGSTTTFPNRTSGGGTTALPMLGGYGAWAVGPDWGLQGRAEFGVGGDRHARLVANARWQPQRNLALNLGYRFIKTRVDVSYSFIGTTRLQINYQAHGPVLAAELAF
jgi:hypothetical protein